MDYEKLGRAAYEEHAFSREWRTEAGTRMREWWELDDRSRAAWRAAAYGVVQQLRASGQLAS